jgi:hypothetical protein
MPLQIRLTSENARCFALYLSAFWLIFTGLGCANTNSSSQTNWATAVNPASDTVPAQIVLNPKRPSKFWMRISQYAICSDVELNPVDPFFRELESLPGQIQTELNLPQGNNVIQVFLFDTQEKYESYMAIRYPKLPSRRAYFIAEPRAGAVGDDLLVFTWMGDQLKTDLRHELTHAVLHSVLKTVPLWLDEGLASYYEISPSNDGLNASHLEAIKKGTSSPDLNRLEGLSKVAQMEKGEYRESWAWVYFLLKSSPATKQFLVRYLADMQTNANPSAIYMKLKEIVPEPEAALVDYLATLK